MRTTQYISFLISLILLFLTIQKCHRQNDFSWSEENQKLFHDQLYTIANTQYTNDQDKEAFATCGLEKAKVAFPYGLNSVSPDSMRRIFLKIVTSCTKEVGPKTSAWTQETEDNIKSVLLASPSWHSIKPADKETLCNCYVQNLKETYPEGIPDTASQAREKRIFKSCIIKLLQEKSNKH